MIERISLVWLLMFGAFAGMAQTLTCTFQFTGSGTLGATTFTNAAITITTIGNTSKRQPNGGGYVGSSIVNDSASISISGIGAVQFTVPTTTMIKTWGNNIPGTGNTEWHFDAGLAAV